MKKKILLISLFCVATILSIAGMSIEKTQASIWEGSPWVEMGESYGISRTEKVLCTKTIDNHMTWDGLPYVDTKVIEWSGYATLCDGAYVATSSCTPSNPCY